MKKMMTAVILIMTLNAHATTEYVPSEAGKRPTDTELALSRGCWQELQTLGCGDPGEDIEQFRSCLNNVYTSLSKNCQKMMSDLYK